MPQDLIDKIKKLASDSTDRESFYLETARLINRFFPHFEWVGFYFLKGGKLHVGPYIGKTTPHTIIDLNAGICGAAVSQKNTIVVDDVNSDPRYLACSLETKSEIVLPIRHNGEIIGELDIDSSQLAAFGVPEREAMEAVVQEVERFLESQGSSSI